MAAITLPNQAYLRDCFLYDPKNGTLIWKRRPVEHFSSMRSANSWNTKFAGGMVGAISAGRIIVSLDDRRYKSHRLIWKLHTGEDVEEIDHINGDTLDNRIANLRPANRSQNSYNTRGRKSHKYPKGVSPFRDKWQAHIKAGKRYYLGLFDTPEAAHAAYCEAAKRLHGDFWYKERTHQNAPPPKPQLRGSQPHR